MSVASASASIPSIDDIIAQSGVQLPAGDIAMIKGCSLRDQINMSITLLVRASMEQGKSVSQACSQLRARENDLNGFVPGAEPEFPVSEDVQARRDFKKLDVELPDSVMDIMGSLFGVEEPVPKKLRIGTPNSPEAVVPTLETAAAAASEKPEAAAAAADADFDITVKKRKADEI